MKKILFLIPNVNGGGAEKTLLEIVRNLDKNKYDITVMKIFDGNFYQKEIEKHSKFKSFFKEKNEKNGKIYNFFIEVTRKIIRSLPPKILYKLFIRESYDIEVAFLEGITVKIIANSSNKNSRKYTWIHTDLEKNHWTKSFYSNLEEEINAYKIFDKCFSVSEATKKAFEIKMKNNNCQVLYNPIDELQITNYSQEEIIDWKKTKLTIVTVGRLTEVKGYDRLLNIHKKLIEKGYNYELLFLGSGEKHTELKKFVIDNKLDNSVKFLGFKKNPYKYMKQADMIVVSSYAEGYSTAVVEATILGIPVVTTNCAGMTDILGDSEYGLVVENTEQALCDGIEKFILNQEIFQHYKIKCQLRAEDFKISKTIKRIETEFDNNKFKSGEY